uniref:Uncharacterized protein n=1 Tax=Timema bartmani TaxID=61472 RepID=A0A7R9EQD3_9NEOP|nr:unnamed protein product [Timema bartmani]
MQLRPKSRPPEDTQIPLRHREHRPGHAVSLGPVAVCPKISSSAVSSGGSSLSLTGTLTLIISRHPKRR